jgi:hypothetical protein
MKANQIQQQNLKTEIKSNKMYQLVAFLRTSLEIKSRAIKMSRSFWIQRLFKM